MTDEKKCAECGATGELTRLRYKGKETPWLCPKCSNPKLEKIIDNVVKEIDDAINDTQTKGDIVTAKKSEKKRDDLRLLPLRKKMLPCILTAEELQKYGGELAKVVEDIGTEMGRQTSFKQQMKATLSALESNAAALSSKICRQEELRDVDVQPEMNFNKGVYREIRTDTGAVISERPLTEEERQGFLPFDKPKAENKTEAVLPEIKKPKSKKKAGESTFEQTATA